MLWEVKTVCVVLTTESQTVYHDDCNAPRGMEKDPLLFLKNHSVCAQNILFQTHYKSIFWVIIGNSNLQLNASGRHN